jgi:hypothetical protein
VGPNGSCDSKIREVSAGIGPATGLCRCRAPFPFMGYAHLPLGTLGAASFRELSPFPLIVSHSFTKGRAELPLLGKTWHQIGNGLFKGLTACATNETTRGNYAPRKAARPQNSGQRNAAYFQRRTAVLHCRSHITRRCNSASAAFGFHNPWGLSWSLLRSSYRCGSASCCIDRHTNEGAFGTAYGL